MTAGLSVVIPAWNSQRLLQANLPSVKEALDRLSVPWELIVVDDGSSDSVSEFLEEVYPDARVIRHGRNRGFSAAIRTGVSAAKHDILYLLNSDVQLEPEALSALLFHFDDPRVFAVASLDVERKSFSMPAFTNRMGLLGVAYVPVTPPSGPIDILFATGGHSAYHAGKFRELCGFDELFAPIYWEDIDCCTRAYARGWRVLLEPSSRVRHRPGSTMARNRSTRTLEAYRAGHRWLFTLRYSSSPSPWAVAMLFAAHGQAAWAALATGLFRIGLIRRHATEAAARTQFSVAAVKRRHAVPWTAAYFSATGEVRGGGEVSLLTLLAGLDRQAVRPLLVCPSDGELVRRANTLGIETHIIPLPPTVRGLADGTLIRLARWLLACGVDIVHANASGRALLLPGLAAKLLGLAVVWHVRIADRQPWTDRLGALLADRLIVTSDFVASRFAVDRVRRKIRRVANPVDLSQFHPNHDGAAWRARLGLPVDRICVGVFGRFDRWKRFEIALQAMAKARGREPRLHLVMVGDGPERATLEQLASRLGASEAVSFVGWQAEPAEAMAAMDILLHPTPGEHFGRIFIEAMACGKPVVAVHSGGAAELVRHDETGVLAPPGDVPALAESIVRLAQDAARRTAMGRAARQQAEQRYSVGRCAGQVLQIYREIVGVET